MIHKYKKNGLNIVLDVDTSTVLTVDELTYELLDHYEDKTRVEIIASFQENIRWWNSMNVWTNWMVSKPPGCYFGRCTINGKTMPNEDLIKALCLHVAHDCDPKCSYCFAGARRL